QWRVEQQSGHPDHAVERCTNFVAHVGEKRAFRQISRSRHFLGEAHLLRRDLVPSHVELNAKHPQRLCVGTMIDDAYGAQKPFEVAVAGAQSMLSSVCVATPFDDFADTVRKGLAFLFVTQAKEPFQISNL